MGSKEHELADRFDEFIAETGVQQIPKICHVWLVREVASALEAARREALEDAAKLPERMAEGIVNGSILPSCGNPILVSVALRELSTAIRALASRAAPSHTPQYGQHDS